MIFDLLMAIGLCIQIGYAIWKKRLKLVQITTAGFTQVRTVIFTGKGLTIALIGLGIVAILFACLWFFGTFISGPLDNENRFFSYLFVFIVWFVMLGIAERFNDNTD